MADINSSTNATDSSNQAQDAVVPGVKPFKTRICRFAINNACKAGPECTFIHSEDPNYETELAKRTEKRAMRATKHNDTKSAGTVCTGLTTPKSNTLGTSMDGTKASHVSVKQVTDAKQVTRLPTKEYSSISASKEKRAKEKLIKSQLTPEDIDNHIMALKQLPSINGLNIENASKAATILKESIIVLRTYEAILNSKY